ncbi:serine/threonine-protein kinase VRK1-like [Entelurus aequoreus]|uniref:serine/threonine-protein kinase VRK1-like n=1 Tax=Entelurus aequoreus TaxID=161455 RepID=UPI002B1E0236|nr:serine/threonine-protein kinase VRK1-like [Entelurus aequoreus]XP_061890278.1 serine/threonine-protein kinase VRK1-like [Entelurus aequoreus]
MPRKAPTAGKGRAPAKRKLAEEFPPGEVLTDTRKNLWKLGAPIGQGGFGVIYLADEDSPKPVGGDARFVIKVEPIDSGPLFSELKFYMRAAKPESIKSWMSSHSLKSLGVPRYWGSGMHERGAKRYRFMVIDRLGTDLQRKLEENGKRFPRKVVLQIGLRLLDILEYIHNHEYVHADIKASNLMLGYSDPNQVYLVDYGLAYRYAPDGSVKDYKENPKRCHDGTIEFTSIDAHKGVAASRRGDLEILGYCMVQWLCGSLPWEDKLQDPLYVRDYKIQSQKSTSEFMTKCFPSQDRPDELQKFMEEVKSLGYQDTPRYDKLRSILQAGLTSIRAVDDGNLDFTAGTQTSGKGVMKRKNAAEMSQDTDGAPTKRRKVFKNKDVSGVKSPTKPQTPKKAPSIGLQDDSETLKDSPVLVKKPRGRPRKIT